MKALLAVVLTLAALYAGFWVLTVRGLDAGISHAVEVARDRGWQVEIGARETSGFPSRFDVTARDVAVASPDRTLGWQIPVLQTAALSYRPNRLIAVLPPEQRLTIGGQEVVVGSDDLRASLHVAASTALGLETLTAEATALDLASSSGWRVSTGPALIAMRRDGPVANSYDVYASTDALRPVLPRVTGLPDTDATLALQADVTLDRPLDRAAVATPARIRTLRLESLDLTWGDLGLRASGDLTVDAQGVPDGQIDLDIASWRDLLALAERAGWVPPGLSPALTSGLTLLSGGQPSLRLPLVLAEGRMALGPIPLGPAPTFR